MLQCLYCDRVLDTRTLHQHIKKKHPEKYSAEIVTRYILEGPGDTPGPASVSPPPQDLPNQESNGPSYKQIIRNSVNPPHLPMVPTTLVGFKIKDHVKQVKPYLNRKVSGVGIVSGVKNGLVEVNFNGTQYYKIAPECLEMA